MLLRSAYDPCALASKRRPGEEALRVLAMQGNEWGSSSGRTQLASHSTAQGVLFPK